MRQLVCMVGMEPPSSLAPDAVRDEKLKVLHSLKAIDDGNAAQLTVRGQYRAGVAEGASVPGYPEELGDSKSNTETFVALKRSEEHTSELQSLMRNSYAVFCLKKTKEREQ